MGKFLCIERVIGPYFSFDYLINFRWTCPDRPSAALIHYVCLGFLYDNFVIS